MSLMSDRTVKQKGKPADVPTVAAALEPDPLADVAVSEVTFKRSPTEELDVVVEPPKPDRIPVQKAVRAPRVRVTQKVAKLMLGSTVYRFEVGQVLDSNQNQCHLLTTECF